MGRTFALADLHGRRDLWEMIKEYLQLDDTIYFLGDAIDRGPDGYELMKELMNDSRVVYLLGNHEQMMQYAISDIHKYGGEWVGGHLDLWAFNGCYPTIEAWDKDENKYRWIKIIDNLPLFAEYINTSNQRILLSHAGFTPNDNYKVDVWNREHFTDEYIIDDDLFIVHGHTPTPYLFRELKRANKDFYEQDGVIFYGNKIDIDCACFSTNHIVLLDLDTLDTIPFDIKGD